jgi:HSP20 family protein
VVDLPASTWPMTTMLTPFFEDRDYFWPSFSLVPSRENTETRKQLRALRPVMDVDFVESEEDYSLHADLPGVEKNEIDLKIENGILTVSAEKRNKHETNTTRSHVIERSYGKVQRSIRLPNNADASNPNAKFENGVLEVKIPKLRETPGTKINIA